MGAKHVHIQFSSAYEAADLWVERALRRDDSLFTPGTPIWSRDWLGEARERFVCKPDQWKGANFFDKMDALLADSPPEVYRLVGEAVNVTYLIVHRSAVDDFTKLSNIIRLIKHTEIPPNKKISDRLRPSSGVMTPGTFFVTQFGVHPAFVIEFAYRWKHEGWGDEFLDRNDPKSPWAFKKVVMGTNLPVLTKDIGKGAPNAQRMALLHLVHPYTFEAMSVPNKAKLAAAPKLQHFITRPSNDVDCRIQQIRAGLEKEIRENFTFFDPDIRPLWNGG